MRRVLKTIAPVLALAAALAAPGPAPAAGPPRGPDLGRLERLAARLDTVRPGNFDVALWGNSDDPDAPGYVGCLAGHAVALFRAEGFGYAPPEAFSGYACCGSRVVTYRGVVGLNATAAFFGVDAEENNFLFTAAGRAGVDPRKAAANVRAVIRSYRPRGAFLSTGDGRPPAGCPA